MQLFLLSNLKEVCVCVCIVCVHTVPQIYFNTKSYISPVILPCVQSQTQSPMIGRQPRNEKTWVLTPNLPFTIVVPLGLHFPRFLSRDHAVLHYKVCLVYFSKLLEEYDCREPSTVLCPQRLSGVVAEISYIIYYP